MLYYGTVQLGMSREDFWLCPLGLFLDLFECHKQWHGLARPKVEVFIDDIWDSGLA